MKVLVFGAKGLLGTTLCRKLTDAKHTVYQFGRDTNNTCQTECEIKYSFSQAMHKADPDCVINLIAATNVDECENNMQHASLLNCFVPHIINWLCRNEFFSKIHFIHISSDQVYSGIGPHSEGFTSPTNIYALTKLMGELPVLGELGCVLRTNFFGKSEVDNRKSFSDWIVNNAQKGTRINVFNDVYFSPLGMDSLCNAIIRSMEIKLIGLYNIGSNSNGISKALMAKRILECLDLDDSLLNFVSVESAQLNARRSKDMRMDSSAFENSASFIIPSIELEIVNEARRYSLQ
jgi:dTDP-4-dehydrorhamnose reductase